LVEPNIALARVRPLDQEHAQAMTDRDDFLAWVRTALYEAELALHNGDPAPRRALWSRNEPVSILGRRATPMGSRRSAISSPSSATVSPSARHMPSTCMPAT
jgi:hypothetical protein